MLWSLLPSLDWAVNTSPSKSGLLQRVCSSQVPRGTAPELVTYWQDTVARAAFLTFRRGPKQWRAKSKQIEKSRTLCLTVLKNLNPFLCLLSTNISTGNCWLKAKQNKILMQTNCKIKLIIDICENWALFFVYTTFWMKKGTKFIGISTAAIHWQLSGWKEMGEWIAASRSWINCQLILNRKYRILSFDFWGSAFSKRWLCASVFLNPLLCMN